MDKELSARLEKIEAELYRWLPDNSNTLISDDIFPGAGKVSCDALYAPVRDILSRGGKRWRPLIMTLVCETLGGGDAAMPLAPLVEFSHNASLIHDDIEDDSDMRRGKISIHKIFGIDTAVNSGSFLYFLSLACIESFPGNKGKIYGIWSGYLRKLHLGQAMDINWHQEIRIIPGIEEYFAMCRMKTGSLARLAVELGVNAAVPEEEKTAEALRLAGEAAEKLGVGFQILDDVKNLTTGIPGKKLGDDIVEGKKSFPVLLYLQKFPEKRDRIFYYFHEAKMNGSTAPEVEEMIETFKKTGVLSEAEETARSMIKEAREFFTRPLYGGLPAGEEGRALLGRLIDLIG